MSKRHSCFAVAVLMFVSLILFSCSKSDKYPLEGTTWIMTDSGHSPGYGNWEETQTIKFQKTTFNWFWVYTVNGNTKNNTVSSGTYNYDDPFVTLTLSESLKLTLKREGDVLFEVSHEEDGEIYTVDGSEAFGSYFVKQ